MRKKLYKMFYIKWIGFIVILLISFKESIAQSSADSVRESNKNIKIALTDIIGNWYVADSLKSRISFVNNGNFYVNIEGIKHGVGNYSFKIDGDSLYVNGTAANWPPYDCTLNLLSNNVLEIKFYQYFSNDTFNIIYCRR